MSDRGVPGTRRIAAAVTVALLSIALFPRIFMSLASPAVKPADAYPRFTRSEFRRFLSETTNRALSGTENYLAARSLQRLHLYTNAIAYFDRVSTNGLPADLAAFLDEASVYFRMQALHSCLIEYDNFPVASCAAETNLFLRLSPSSPYFPAALEKWLYWNYRASNDGVLASQTYPGDKAAAYRAFGRFRLKENGAWLSAVAAVDSLTPAMRKELALAVSNAPSNASADDCNRMLNLALDNNNLALADSAVERHYAKTGDEDFAKRNRMRLLYRRGLKQEALSGLAVFAQSGKASIQTAKLLYHYQGTGGNPAAAFLTLSNSLSRWGQPFYGDYIKSLGARADWKGLSDWAFSMRKTPDFNGDWGGKIYRVLLQNATNLAAEYCVALGANGGTRKMRFYAALTLLDRGQKAESYPLFLDLTLLSAYTWEWLEARNYEASLRPSFAGVYSNRVAELLRKFKKEASVSGRESGDALRFYSAFSEADPAWYRLSCDQNRIDEGVKKLTRGQLSHFEGLTESEIRLTDIYFLSTNGFIPALGADWIDRAERKLDSFKDKAALFYRHRDFYRDYAPAGTVLSRLNYFINDANGERTIHPVVENWLFRELYPPEGFETVLSYAGNTNRARWLLSAFREESHFSQADTSWAGAVGFTQLMPGTADTVKRGMKHAEFSIYDRQDNIEIGSSHLSWLFRRFGDDPVAALSAYNAGEGAWQRWKRVYNLNAEFAIEAMDYEETREYVRRIQMTEYFYRKARPEGM